MSSEQDNIAHRSSENRTPTPDISPTSPATSAGTSSAAPEGSSPTTATDNAPAVSQSATAASAGDSAPATAESEEAQLTAMVSALAKTFAVARTDVTDERLAHDLVYNAGRLAWRLREGGLTTEYKTSISDVVTVADRACEQFIADVLHLLRPEDGLVGEEGTSHPGSSGRYWVIDPVDGTYNFTRGSDYWCSAVALIESHSKSPDPQWIADNPDRIILGAIHRPAMGYTWVGGPKTPSRRDNVALAHLDNAQSGSAADRAVAGAAPSATSAAPLRPEMVCLGTYLHPTSMQNPPIRDAWLRVATLFASTRMLGSSSIDLAGVAEGELGGWIQHSVKSWDWLPGLAIILGVGGTGRHVVAGGTRWSIAGPAPIVDAMENALLSAGNGEISDGRQPQSLPAPGAATRCGSVAATPWHNHARAADVDAAWELAEVADTLTMSRFNAADLRVESKPDLTPVSDADTATEKALRERLAELFPQDPIVGEEFGGEAVFTGRQWIIDPIDGTKNYVRGVPVWATLIALLEDGKPVVGVVSAPALGRRWVGVAASGVDGAAAGVLRDAAAAASTATNPAADDAGLLTEAAAWVRDDKDAPLRRIHVSGVERIEDCSVSISSLTGWRDRGLRENLVSLTDDAWRLRGFGDFFSYCLVAEGAVDVAAEPEVSVWDLSALVPIVEGAGGRFTSLAGVDGPHGGDAIATNGLLHDAVLGRLGAHS